MTVQNIPVINKWTGNGTNKIFDFDFRIDNENQLRVSLLSDYDTPLVLGTDYRIIDIDNGSNYPLESGQIEYPLSTSEHGVLTNEETIILELSIPFVQAVPFSQGGITASAIEECLDYNVRLMQRLKQDNDGFKDDIETSFEQFQTTIDGEISTIQTSVNTANTNASNAVIAANSANTKADNAVSTANAANTNASNAVITANNASSVANTASTNATNAVNTANSASSTATAASNKVDEFGQSIATVVEAASKINQLEQSVTTATNAATTATNKASEATTAAQTATSKAQEAATSATAATGKVGDLEDLTTTAKNTVVDAVNEVKASIPTTLSSFNDDLGSNPVHTHSNKADTDLSNLSGNGNAKFMYAPFSINNGTVDANGNNVTLYTNNDTEYVIKQEYPNYKPTSNNDTASGIVTTPISGWSNGASAYKVLAGNLAFNNNILITEFDFPNPIEIVTLKTVTSNYWGMRLVEVSAYDETLDDYVVIISGSYTNANTTTKTFSASQIIKTQKLKFRLRGGIYQPNETYYNTLNSLTITGYEYITLTGGSNLYCLPCTITTANNFSKTFESSACLDCTSCNDGTYRVLKDINTGDLSLTVNLYVNNISPENPTNGDYWLDISKVPFELKTYDNDSWVTDNNKAYLGKVTVIDNAIDNIENVRFNFKNICSVLPSKKYEDLAWGASGTKYVAPADGWYYACGKTSTSKYHDLALYVLSDSSSEGGWANSIWGMGMVDTATYNVFALVPVKKGDIVQLAYYAELIASTKIFRFIYAESSEWEA